MVTPDEVDMLRTEIEAIMSREDPGLKEHTKRNMRTAGRFVSSFNMWESRPLLAEFTRTSRLPELAADLMGADKINLLFDQSFVKEPGTVDATPWHSDQPYWPILGKQVITIWIALDRVTKDSGAVEFVAGSNTWDRWFQASSFSGENELSRNERFEEMPDIDANRDRYDIVSWDLDPVTFWHSRP